jgi:hypothetical protein
MNASPEPDPDFESLLRHRASRLAKPDPVWREEILEAARIEATVRPRCSGRPLWKTRWFPASLAACWLVIPLLNWSAERETRRFSHYANAQAVPMVMGSLNQSVLLAAASSR